MGKKGNTRLCFFSSLSFFCLYEVKQSLKSLWTAKKKISVFYMDFSSAAIGHFHDCDCNFFSYLIFLVLRLP